MEEEYDINPLDLIPQRRPNRGRRARNQMSRQIAGSAPYKAAEFMFGGKNYDGISVKDVISAAPYMLKEFYDAAPISEMLSEVVVPWQYKEYEKAMKEGREYEFDPSAFAADALEVLGPTAPFAVGVDIMDDAFDAGKDFKTALTEGATVGAAAGVGSMIPFAGKLGRFIGKAAPYAEKAFNKVFPKVATPASIGTMVVAPPVAQGLILGKENEQ